MARRPLLVVLLTALLLAALATHTFAFSEPTGGAMSGSSYCGCHNGPLPGSGNATEAQRAACQRCHGYTSDQFPLGERNAPDVMKGPHGGYTTGTDKCSCCHTLHDAPAADLLPAATLVGTCFTCHDGTGGWGVYGAVKARTGRDPATDLGLGSHRVEATSVVPGGDAATGGAVQRVFGSTGGKLGCGDCHTPHDAQAVTAYQSERKRTRTYEAPDRPTSKLLKRRPSSATTAVAEYGSDWCAACHKGRMSGGAVVNHPVDSLETTTAPFVVRSIAGGRTLAIIGGGTRHHDPAAGITGLGNLDFQMAFPRTAEQGTHKPICQQCHEDTRDTGDLAANGTRVNVPARREGSDGLDAADNPRFQNFPHETENDKLIIELGDDLCLNCHPLMQLP